MPLRSGTPSIRASFLSTSSALSSAVHRRMPPSAGPCLFRHSKQMAKGSLVSLSLSADSADPNGFGNCSQCLAV